MQFVRRLSPPMYSPPQVIRSITTSWCLHPPTAVKIVEVGPRDGLQNESLAVSVKDKVALIAMLADAGCQFIEAGSFVSPSAIPAMANSADVMKELRDLWDRSRKDSRPLLSCLIPNVLGLNRAIELRADEVAIFGSASETFSQRNIRCSISESMERFDAVSNSAKLCGIPVRGYLSCVIACPYEGRIDAGKVATLVEKLLEMGCHEVSLGDTIGVGTPMSTLHMLDEVLSLVGAEAAAKIAVHFHDTYGQALANILVSLEKNINTVDTSVGGLGGCPYAKGATGNVASEDVIYMLNGLGVETGINIDRMVDAAEFISAVLGRPIKSKVGSAVVAKRKLIL